MSDNDITVPLNVAADIALWMEINKVPPAGEGSWAFQLGGLGGPGHEYIGSYEEALRAAKQRAQVAGVDVVFLVPA